MRLANHPAIEVRDLVMQFPQQQGWKALFKREPGKMALRGINLTIPTGEIFGMLGPNGAGKTTLIKVLTTLTIPSSGEALVTGLDVVKSSIEVRSRVGVVYGDERTFFWRLSAFDNLLFYAALYHIPEKQARRRAAELLEMVGLREAMHLRMHHYSSGMKQRASIARGLLNDPDILIMDEPTRSLDPIAAQELRRLVKDRVADGQRTVLVATNIMAEAEYLCDRIAFINRGQIQLVGEIEDLRGILQSEEKHELVAGGVSLAAVECLRTLPGVDAMNVATDQDGRVRLGLTVRREMPVMPTVVRAIVDLGGDVWSSTPSELTLDEMFSIVVEKSQAVTGLREKVPV
ncbi:MAG: ABC transporter ATP-binding protein [Dehalococcoidia bacterium]